MEDKTHELIAKLVDLIMAQHDATNRVLRAVELTNGTMTQLTALALRLERRLDDVPAE